MVGVDAATDLVPVHGEQELLPFTVGIAPSTNVRPQSAGVQSRRQPYCGPRYAAGFCGQPQRSSSPVLDMERDNHRRGSEIIMADKVTLPALLQMKREGRKCVGVVAWDYQIARIADRAGVDFVSVGDFGRRQSVGPRQPARSHARRDAGGLQGGAPRGVARAGQLRFPVRSAAGGHRQRAARRHPAGQGGRRRHRQARRRIGISRCGACAGARRHPGVRAVRAHAADRDALRHPLQRAERRRARRRPPR